MHSFAFSLKTLNASNVYSSCAHLNLTCKYKAFISSYMNSLKLSNILKQCILFIYTEMICLLLFSSILSNNTILFSIYRKLPYHALISLLCTCLFAIVYASVSTSILLRPVFASIFYLLKK